MFRVIGKDSIGIRILNCLSFSVVFFKLLFVVFFLERWYLFRNKVRFIVSFDRDKNLRDY